MERFTPSVEGPDVLTRYRASKKIVDRLVANNWDFDSVSEVLPRKTNQSDVLGKEIIYIHDGERETIIGKVLLGGMGSQFNLIGPVTFNSEFRVTPTQPLLDSVNEQLGTKSFDDFDVYRRLPTPQRVEFYNHTIHLSLEDLVLWHVMYGSGVFPSSLEFMRRHFAAGMLVHNNSYKLPAPPRGEDKVTYSVVDNMVLTYPTKVMEWMHLPVYAGLDPHTLHIEYLVTPQESEVSHPQLKMSHQGKIDLFGTKWYIKRFAGLVQKEGARSAKVSQEGADAVQHQLLGGSESRS